LSFNEFAAQMLIDGRPLEDPQLKSLYLEIDREHRFQPPLEYYKMVVEDTAWRHGFHPVKQYLDSITWDQKPRLDTWLIRCAGVEDSLYTRAVSSIMLIAAVRRIRQPGCKYDEMVVWESHQGSEKSSAAQALCPNPDWFSDDLRLNLHAQELIEATLGKWIIEASDLAGKKKTEIEQLKAMLSRQRDGPARMAYAHFPVERPRHFIIIGTTNSSAYLTDATGGRRFWPMEVQRFNLELIRRHRDQLWAEACIREGLGESIRLREELWPAATEQQEKRREVDPWEPLLRRAVLAVAPGSGGRRRVIAGILWDVLGVPTERRDRYGSLRITEIMQRLGFKRSRVRPEGEEVQVGFIQMRVDDTELKEES
jgi:predicted P-loop ATPase